jgi:hypothetical protein
MRFRIVFGRDLHDNSKSVLEAGEVGSIDGSRGSQSDLWCDILDERSRDGVAGSVLGLDGSKRSLVGATESVEITSNITRVSGRRGNRKIVVDLVKEAKRDLGKLVSTGETGKDGSVGVASTGVQGTEAGFSREGVCGISSNLDSRGKTNAGGGAELGHLNNIKDASSIQVSVGVVNSEVSSLVGLEGKLDIGCDTERGLQDASTVGGSLGLIDIELGVGKLGSNLGRKSSALAPFGLNGDGDGASTLLAFERSLGSVVFSQKI